MDASEGMQFERKPVTLDTLQSAFKSLSDARWALRKSGNSEDEAIAQEQQLLKEFIEKQIHEKDNFRNIFRTERGSIYFTLDTGESMRIKQNGDKLKLQPICKKIFYVNAHQDASLMAMQERSTFQEAIIGLPIGTVLCNIGVTPIEFGISHFPEILFKEELGKIIITGDNTGVFASGYHQGHPITEVIK